MDIVIAHIWFFIVVLAFVWRIIRLLQLPRWLVLCGVILLPIPGFLGWYIYAVIGDLSVLSLLTLVFWQRRTPTVNLSVAVAVAVAGIALYASTLSSSNIDIYRWGFVAAAVAGIHLFAGTLVLIAAYLLYCKQLVGVVSLLVAVNAWYFKILPSDNLWDYVVDVWLVLGIIAWLLYKAAKTLATRRCLMISKRGVGSNSTGDSA